MKKRVLLIILALFLLTGCTPEANVSTPAPTSTTPVPGELYPTELEQDFVVLCDWIDRTDYLPNPICSTYFYLITKEPITAEDITVKTGELQWKVKLRLQENYDAEGFSVVTFYNAFLAYKQMDWSGLYDLTQQSISKGNEVFAQYKDDCAQKWEDWYPEFYCYDVYISEPDCSALSVKGKHIETDISVTVKGNTQLLEDVCNIVIYEDCSAILVPDDIALYQSQSVLSSVMVRPTDEGYFYSSDDSELTARKNLTITGAGFQNNDTASFIKMELVVGDVRMEWDGKTPVDVAAGEIVKFRFIAQDPILGGVLSAYFERNAQLAFTCEGKRYTVTIYQKYSTQLDPYQCYAIANGRRDALYSYFVDYYNKASGWQPGYIKADYNGSGATGNPFLDG